jgi:3-hydroxymyristoyl/3-hydroxydecanoyl-(acyl carrier protein) dehydratase
MGAFSFVDHISEFEPGMRVRGRYQVPPGASGFPVALATEAVGQLAAWSAMDKLAFALRPVAGLAGQVLFHGEVRPGDLLELEADLDNCDETAVSYGGAARVGGKLVVELRNCVGPMLPMAEFDSPEALRERLRQLRGAAPIASPFRGIPDPVLLAVDRGADEERCRLQVPAEAPFFADHFPRKPVFPGTLLLNAQMQMTTSFLRQAGIASDARPISVGNVKVRSFTVPGQQLELHVKVSSVTGGTATVKQTASAEGRTVSTGQAILAIGVRQ